MKAEALQQAKSRLVRATQAIETLKTASTVEDAEAAWTDFLLAAATIYSKLEQGAKTNGKSQAWYGRKKKERRDDQLLLYLHFARNSDEHGIERVVETTTANPNLKFNERYPLKVQKLDQITHEPVGEPGDVVIAGPTIRPVRAWDSRFGDYCDPPTEHRGAVIRGGGDFCYDVGIKGVAYLTELLEEAEGLPPS
jgi:hypothetical protein